MMLRQGLWGSATRLLLLKKQSTSRATPFPKSILNDATCRQHAMKQASGLYVQRVRYQLSTSSLSASSSQSSSSSAAFAAIHRFHGLPRFAEFYLRMLSEKPVLTKSTTAAAIYFFADVTSQKLSNWSLDDPKEARWDVGRTMHMFAVGMFMSGPLLHLWFNFLLRYFPKRDVLTTIKKIAMSQFIYGPAFTVTFFSLNAFVQGESMDDIILRLKRDVPRTMKNGILYWPACDYINHRYVPVHLQALVSNGFSFIWTVYMTYMACLKKVELVTDA